MNEVFVPESPEHARESVRTWQQGETLPMPNQGWSQSQTLSPPASSPENCCEVGSIGQIQSMLQVMQDSIEANFKDVKGTLSELEVRITNVEDKQLTLNPSTPTSSSSESVTEFGRKRRNPPELQVCMIRYK